jgi:putative endonuclease
LIEKSYCVYIMTNITGTVLYTGMTSNLYGRVDAHKRELVDGFTKKYKVKNLVYYEPAEDLDSALYREKQIKDYSRKKKLDLINSMNPKWEDLFSSLNNW